jgi:hypothetical protein
MPGQKGCTIDLITNLVKLRPLEGLGCGEETVAAARGTLSRQGPLPSTLPCGRNFPASAGESGLHWFLMFSRGSC